jgi:riboflavin kinase/FMN adenylyltransferase
MRGSGRIRTSRTVGVTHHRALWSPDFPLAGRSRSATIRPARGTVRLYKPNVNWRLIAVANRSLQLHHDIMTVASREKFGESRVTRLPWQEMPPEWARRGVVAVGNFDGVHRGHAALVHQASDLARTVDGPVTLITFDPHPLQLLDPDRFQPLLTTVDDRASLLAALGADAVVILRTDADLLQLSADAFFDQILVNRLNAKGIVEGFNFRFGHNRRGTVDTLRQKCGRLGIPFCIVEPFRLEDMVVSSSRVRSALMEGAVKAAAELLNRPYQVHGIVVAGAKRGRTIGFPTANLDGVTTLLPKDGVFAVRASVDGRTFAGAANIGPNPTFGENARKIEVHLIGFDGDLYGKTMAVDFIERLRDTRRFKDVAELTEQMKRDVEQARWLLA